MEVTVMGAGEHRKYKVKVGRIREWSKQKGEERC
jgi:hypothetical protein